MSVNQQVTDVVGIRAPGQLGNKVTVAMEHGSVTQKISLFPGKDQDTQVVGLHFGSDALFIPAITGRAVLLPEGDPACETPGRNVTLRR